MIEAVERSQEGDGVRTENQESQPRPRAVRRCQNHHYDQAAQRLRASLQIRTVVDLLRLPVSEYSLDTNGS